MESKEEEVTAIIQAVANGNDQMREKLFNIVYSELKVIARNAMMRERRDHTLQPTALVHEAYVKLIGQNNLEIKDKAHFYSVVATAMRHILVDYARRKKAQIRGGDLQKEPLDDPPAPLKDEIDTLALYELIEAFEDVNPRASQIVQFFYFVGLSVDEIGRLLVTSRATVYNELKAARKWFNRKLR